MHRAFQASMSNTDHHKTTLCVLTEQSIVGWHTVPWLHTSLIFWRTELLTQRYWSHSSKTMEKSKAVPVYTMTTYRGSTVTAALICNLSRKWSWVISLMQQLLQCWGRIHNMYWIKARWAPGLIRCSELKECFLLLLRNKLHAVQHLDYHYTGWTATESNIPHCGY